MKTNANNKPLTTDASLLKQINFARILSLLRYHPRLSRADIARRTGLTRSTVTVITAELMATGLLREGRETASGSEGGASWCGVRTRSRGSLLYRGCDWS